MKEKRQVVNIHSLRFYLGCLFAVIVIAISIFIYNNLKAGVVFAVLFILSGAIRLSDFDISQRSLVILYVGWVVITAFVTLALSQFCLNEVLPERGLPAIILGVFLIIFLFLLPFIITLRIRTSVILVSAFLILFTCLNYFVFVFRGSEIAPADILSVTTAGNVAAEYSFRVPVFMFYALVLYLIYFFAIISFPAIIIDKRKSTKVSCSVLAIICAIIVFVGGHGIKPLHWRQTGSVANGYLLNFTLMLDESRPKKPIGYSHNLVSKMAKKTNIVTAEGKGTTDIIVVMDESFADLNKLGNELHTNLTVTPFIDSLKDNTLRGYALASVFGGGTPNSEYEFLTGNSCLFLPTGSIVYQQFIKGPIYSFARELKNRGYRTVAMHQYLSNSWMRSRIWPLLGFDQCLFQEEFPQRDRLRDWGTDQELFEKIVSLYEEHRGQTKTPIFVYAVTIQNHGGYNYSDNDFKPSIQLHGYSQTYKDVEQYLSCIHKTDISVKWLIDYFSKVNRNVVILFYGDHFPGLNESFFEEIHGKAFDTLDEQMLQYEVPFFIWTNYETEADETDLISMNYLSNLLYQRAGLALPPYNQYLEKLRKTIPACNAYGYYSLSSEGFVPLKEAEKFEKKALLEYSYLEWNNMFDKKNRNNVLFPID